MPKRVFPSFVIVLLFWLGSLPLPGSPHKKEPAGAGPEERILVGELGYRPPGSLYMLSGRAFSSLDFIDDRHLLFTFHQPRLMRREENPGRSEDDQIIQADILGVPGGAVEVTAEWRMHDRSRYLWSLGGGKFLVRQRNSYSLTDTSLKLRPYIEVATPVLATEVSPDGRILLIEHQYERHTPEQHTKLEAQAAQYGEPPPAEDTQITLLKISSREVLGAVHVEFPAFVPVTTTGYVSVARDKGADAFLVRFVPFEGQSLVLGKVESTCTPHENFLNQEALIIESCGPKSTDLFLDAWTIAGKKLWSGRREGHLVWPNLAYSRNGERFAVSTLRVAHFVDRLDSITDEDVHEQVIQVFDSATGTLLMATTASPILTGGQNFALSDDGVRLAVLREGAIELYRVPSPPAPEKPLVPAPKKR